MWNLRRLGRMPALRRATKGIFERLYWDGRTIVIARGPLEGYKWVCNTQHQFWMPLGLYEQETSRWLAEHVKDGDLFLDIGANAGYFTLLGSKQVGQGCTIAFEPVPANVATIARHLAANQLTNVVLEEMVVADEEGTVDFIIENNNANSHMSDLEIAHAEAAPQQVIRVQTTTLDHYLAERGLSVDVIKIDVEGAELRVLAGAQKTIRDRRPTVIVSTHSPQLREGCRAFFENEGYQVIPLANFTHELCCYPRREN